MSKHAYCRHTYELDVPFYDVDAMQIVWHGHYVKYLEEARCAFLERIGHTYLDMRDQGHAWPVVQLQLKYIKPAHFRQRLRVTLAVVEYETCLRIDYTISDAQSGEKLSQASTTQVAVELVSGDMQYLTPPSWQEALRRQPDFCEAPPVTPRRMK